MVEVERVRFERAALPEALHVILGVTLRPAVRRQVDPGAGAARANRIPVPALLGAHDIRRTLADAQRVPVYAVRGGEVVKRQ